MKKLKQQIKSIIKALGLFELAKSFRSFLFNNINENHEKTSAALRKKRTFNNRRYSAAKARGQNTAAYHQDSLSPNLGTQYKHKFAMYCKSYVNDFGRLKVLVDSFNKYNVEKLNLFVSVPEIDLDSLSIVESDTVHVISDESFAASYFAQEGHWGMSIGYANQEICKLTFHKTKIALNYLCLDSDVTFIREFRRSDFMYTEDTPYTVLVQDKDLSIERHYRTVHWLDRQTSIKRIYDFVELQDPRLRTCHGMQIMNALVLESLEENIVKKNNFTWNDLLKISPYEFTWYNAWFQKSKIVEEIAIEPLFKTLHMRPEYIFSRLKLLRVEDYAQEYIGIVLNSKWRPRRTPLVYEDPNMIMKMIYAVLTKIL